MKKKKQQFKCEICDKKLNKDDYFKNKGYCKYKGCGKIGYADYSKIKN